MKKVIMMLTMVLPIILMAQNRPSVQKKSALQEKTKVNFEYLEMHAEKLSEAKTVSSPKKKKSKDVSSKPVQNTYNITFNYSMRMSKGMMKKELGRIGKVKNPLEALEYLGSLGWELIAVSGDNYYLKRKSR